MIDTLFFALQIVGIVVLLAWAVLHDRLEPGSPVRGPLAFKQDEPDAVPRSRSRRQRGARKRDEGAGGRFRLRRKAAERLGQAAAGAGRQEIEEK